VPAHYKLYLEGIRTFNSLSRDHSWGHPRGLYPRFKLSTPSLGITRSVLKSERSGFRLSLSTPSLGITDLSSGCRNRKRPSFNSLSRDHLEGVVDASRHAVIQLSTPSLGITTHDRASRITGLRQHLLSTPSLGITSAKNVSSAIAPTSLRSFNSLSRDHSVLFSAYFANSAAT
jgi:hypothetical protein